MSNNADFSLEIRLFCCDGQELYLTNEEREEFLQAAKHEDPDGHMFYQLLHYTGYRPPEALELTPVRILLEEQSVVFRSLKKWETDKKRRAKLPQYRLVPIPEIFIEHLDVVFNLRFLHIRRKRLEEQLRRTSQDSRAID